MESRPTISVVIPCFNAAGYIEPTIASVLKQGIENIEIIAVDDNSTDSTHEILHQLKERYSGSATIRILPGEGKGPAKARNIGIQESKGRYIAFLDADDLWEPGKLEKQLSELERQGAEEALSYTDRIWVDGDGQPIPEPHVQQTFPQGRIFTNLIDGNYLVTSSVVVSRSALDKVGGFNEAKEFANCQDYDLWIRLSNLIPFFPVKEPLIRYRVHENNRHKNMEPRYRGLMACLDTLENSSFWENNDISGYRERMNKRRFNLMTSYALHFLRDRNFSLAQQIATDSKQYGDDLRMDIIRFSKYIPDHVLNLILAARKRVKDGFS